MDAESLDPASQQAGGERSMAAAVRTFFTRPDGAGDGTWDDPVGPVALSSLVNMHIAASSVRIVFLGGRYTDRVQITRVSHPRHVLTLEGQADASAAFTYTGDGNNKNPMLYLGKCKNIVIRNIHFRQADSILPGKRVDFLKIVGCDSVRIEKCTWLDLSVHMGAVRVAAGSNNCFISECVFSRLGLEASSSGNHVIYATSGSEKSESKVRHLVISHCRFLDNFGGSYVKFWGVEDSSVLDCTFLRQGIGSESRSVSGVFIQINNRPRNPKPERAQITSNRVSAIGNTFINNLTDKVAKGVWFYGEVIREGLFSNNVGVGHVSNVNPVISLSAPEAN